MQKVQDLLKQYKFQVGAVLVLALAIFMRFYHLTSLPPGLYPDEAANGLDVLQILQHHNWQPFYEDNGGREGLFFYLQSIGVAIFGNTTYALRVVPAIIGTLAVGAVYLWVSAWFGRRTGFIAASLMAVTPWAVTVSRDGFRAGMLALLIPLALWLGTQAHRTNQLWWYGLCGLSIGAGFYTYPAFQVFPIVAAVGLIYLGFRRRDYLVTHGRGIVLALIVSAGSLVPLGIYTLHHPGAIFGRAVGVSFTNPKYSHNQPLPTLTASIVKTALMFNFQGDENYRHNLGGQPMLNIFVGVMFVLGIFVCLSRLASAPHIGVVLLLFIMLLPAILTAEGVPHALRSIGALPAALALAALGISYMLDLWYSVFPLNTAAQVSGTVAVGILMLLTVYQGYVQYFVAWANSPETYAAFNEDTSSIAKFYLEHSFKGERYAVGNSNRLSPLEYLAHDHVSYTVIDVSSIAKLKGRSGIAMEFALKEDSKADGLNQLEITFPKGHISPHYSSFSGNELFVIYTVPAP